MCAILFLYLYVFILQFNIPGISFGKNYSGVVISSFCTIWIIEVDCHWLHDFMARRKVCLFIPISSLQYLAIRFYFCVLTWYSCYDLVRAIYIHSLKWWRWTWIQVWGGRLASLTVVDYHWAGKVHKISPCILIWNWRRIATVTSRLIPLLWMTVINPIW